MSEPWPIWADEPIELMPFDDGWAQAAATERDALHAALAGFGVGAIHHIGSTAIPGLLAKPILDLMAASDGIGALDASPDFASAAAAASGSAVPAIDAALAELGYQRVPPELDARPWRRFYIKPRQQRRYAHLHLLSASHPRWREALWFRDFLRAHDRERDAYAALKRDLAESHRRDREAYSRGKAEFVSAIVARARAGR